MVKITWPEVGQKSVLIVILLAFWGIAYSLFGEHVGVDSEIVMLIVLFVGAKFTGFVVSLLKCPAILGQMFFGIFLANIGYFHLTPPYLALTAILRQVALVNIMLPAGLNLDPAVLKQRGIMAVLLGIIPAAVEVTVMAVLVTTFLRIPILWAILMGLILAAVSPSVIFPCLFELEDNQGLGIDSGVNTLMVAASTLNDIVSIAIYIAHLNVATMGLTQELLKGPIGFGIGIIFGYFWGFLARLIPDKSDPYVVTLRTMLIGVGSLFICIGSDAIGYPSAGVLGCIVTAFVASLGYRKEGWIGAANPVKNNFIMLWQFFEPISFGLIGVAVKLELLHGRIILWMLIFSIVALLGRCVTAYWLGFIGRYTKNERIFFAICAIPKATVQATLGPSALDKAVTTEQFENANNVLILSVMSIILTAPIGAWLILTVGPKLLTKKPKITKIHDHNLEEVEEQQQTDE